MPSTRRLRASSRLLRASAREMEGADREHLLDAGEAVTKAPELVAVGLDEEIQAIAIGELERLLPRARRFDVEESERHVCITFADMWVRSRMIPTKSREATCRHATLCAFKPHQAIDFYSFWRRYVTL